MSTLTDQIDQSAVECCKLMSATQAKKFFSYQKNRIKSGEFSAVTKVSAVGVYYKGPRKGQVREAYEVDGKKFNKLWGLLQNYAYKSASVSHSFQNSEAAEEDVMEIRYMVFRALRFFGPRPNNLNFSAYYPLLVNNVLTNSAKKRLEIVDVADTQISIEETYEQEFTSEPLWYDSNLAKKRKVAETTSVPARKRYKKHAVLEPVSLLASLSPSNSEGESLSLIDCVAATDESIEFMASIPKDLKEPVSMLLGGYKLSEIAKTLGIAKRTLEQRVQMFAMQG